MIPSQLRRSRVSDLKSELELPDSIVEKPVEEKFLIKHLSSGKFLSPAKGGDNLVNETAVVLNKNIHDSMQWTFQKIDDYWGYIKHVSSEMIIHPLGGEITSKDCVNLMLHSDRHWGALFALDGANQHIIHKSGRFVQPKTARPNPVDESAVELFSEVNPTMRFQFVTPLDHDKEVLIYGKPKLLGKWKINYMVRNPVALHVDKMDIKIGKAASESRTSSFQFRFEASASASFFGFGASTSMSTQSMMERTSAATWSDETTRTREIRVKPGKSVVTWQYVFETSQCGTTSLFRSNLFADTDSEANVPNDLQYTE